MDTMVPKLRKIVCFCSRSVLWNLKNRNFYKMIIGAKMTWFSMWKLWKFLTCGPPVGSPPLKPYPPLTVPQYVFKRWQPYSLSLSLSLSPLSLSLSLSERSELFEHGQFMMHMSGFWTQFVRRYLLYNFERSENDIGLRYRNLYIIVL